MKTSFNELKTRNILSKEQMQNVKGGGTCGYKLVHANGAIEFECNISMDDIQEEMEHATYLQSEVEENIRFNWCCDSCYKSSYCG